MNNLFVRSQHNPVLLPNPAHAWESLKVYNPGAIFYNRKYHLFYRAMGRGDDWNSALGHAISSDGEHFHRFPEPALFRDLKNPDEFRGLEDPRITKIDDTILMAYAAYDGKVPRLHVATSQNLRDWTRHARAFSDFNFTLMGGTHVRWTDGVAVELPADEMRDDWTKSGAIFPESIGGKYWMLFNEYRIWLATSDDAVRWNAIPEPLISPRKDQGRFDNTFVEMGPPPIRTEKGWLVLYHGINDVYQYHLGALLLDLHDPTRVLCRPDEPIFGPREKYELSGIIDVIPGVMNLIAQGDDQRLHALLGEAVRKGHMPQVTFTPAAVLVDGIVRLFYGAGDQFICTATAPLEDILATLR